ncbi:MAG: YdcF family protein [Desulfobaccales bacterium]
MPTADLSLDCLIVLGARINPEGRPGRIARMRLEHALTLWRENGGRSFILLTGGCSRPGLAVSEARVMADYALAQAEAEWGAEAAQRLQSCLLLEENSLSTRDSAENTLALIRERNFTAVGLVSDPLHLRRAHYLFRRHFRRHPVLLHPLPVPGVIRHYWHNRRYLWLTKMVCREAAAWLKVLTPRPPRGKKLRPR